MQASAVRAEVAPSGLGFKPVETLLNPTRGSRNGSVETALWGDRDHPEEREIAGWGCLVREGGVVHTYKKSPTNLLKLVVEVFT